MNLVEQKNVKSIQITQSKASDMCQLCGPSPSYLPKQKKSKETCNRCGNNTAFSNALVQVSWSSALSKSSYEYFISNT